MTGFSTAALDDAADRLMSRPESAGITLALVVMHRDELILERYGHQPASVFGPGGPVGADTPLISWSMAKSITHAAVGVMVGAGRLDLDAPAAVPAWEGTGKAAITLLDLLEMRSGLRFVEDYVDASTSDCLEMLFGAGAADHAAFAASMPLEHPPGTVWNYSSGTTNIICRILGDLIGGGPAEMRAFLAAELFDPIGMASADPQFDASGTWVGSSYLYATARDFARFGSLYLHDGVTAEGRRLLPPGWVDHARTVVAHDPAEAVPAGFDYGRHWWMWPTLPGSLAAHGYEGQYMLVVPDRELVLVHLGKTPAEMDHLLVERLDALVRTR